jgi:hexokinase
MNGTAEQLFDFIAEKVAEFILKHSKNEGNNNLTFGFTFSFPVNQTGIASGTLIQWTKGFSTSGVEGKDVVSLLDAAFQRKNVHAKVILKDKITINNNIKL